MVRLFPFSYFAARRAAQLSAWAAGNAALEGKIQHHVEEHAKAAAEALFSHRGRKVRKSYFPDKEALAREIAAHRLSLLKLRGESLLRRAKKGTYGYSALTLGFASFAAETALKGPFAIKHRLGSFGEVMHQVYGDKATMSSEAKRLGRLYNSIGRWRFFTRYTQPVSLAWMAGRMHQWTVIPTLPKPLVELAKKIPILPKVLNLTSKILFLPTIYGWSSNAIKLHLLKREIGHGARYGLRLGRFPAKLVSAQYGQPAASKGLDQLQQQSGEAHGGGGHDAPAGHEEQGHAGSHVGPAGHVEKKNDKPHDEQGEHH